MGFTQVLHGPTHLVQVAFGRAASKLPDLTQPIDWRWHSARRGGYPVDVYLDGSCWPNPGGPGGWAWVRIPSTGPTVTARGGIPSPSTNNRAELCAMIAALRALPADSRHVCVWSDSQYVLGLTHLALAQLPFAKRFKNPDLLELLAQALSKFTHPPCFVWVRGHSGVAGNERADQLAERARQEVSNVK